MTCVVATTLQALHDLCVATTLSTVLTLQALHDLCGGHYTADCVNTAGTALSCVLSLHNLCATVQFSL